MSSGWRIAVAGASGVYGEALLRALEAGPLSASGVRVLASAASAGQGVEVGGEDVALEALEGFDFAAVDCALFAVPADVARVHVPLAAEAGAFVLDASAAYAGDAGTPLAGAGGDVSWLAAAREARIARMPQAMAQTLAQVLGPIAQAAGLEAVRVAGYHAVAGAGRAAIEELAGQCRLLLNGRPAGAPGPAFARRIAFNCLPAAGAAGEGRGSDAERQVEDDLLALLDGPAPAISYHGVYVPSFFGDGAVVHLTTSSPISSAALGELLAQAPGVGHAPAGPEPTPALEATDHDRVLVGALREGGDRGRDHSFWIAADNLRRSAVRTVGVLQALAQGDF